MTVSKKILFSLMMLLLFLIVAEVLPRPFLFVGDARIVDANDGRLVLKDYTLGFPRPRPDFEGRLVSGEFDVVLATDREGQRVHPQRSEPADADLELLMVGDSVTFGHGVEFEDTFGFVLARRLEEQLGVRVRLVNLGCPGTGIRSQRLRLQWYLESAADAPRLIVWTTLLNDGFGGGNDLLDTWNSVQDAEAAATAADAGEGFLTNEARREAPRSLLHETKDWLSRHSVLYELMMRATGLTVRAYAPKDATPEQRQMLDRAWDAYGEELTRAASVVEAEGSPFFLGYYPYFHDVAQNDGRTLERLQAVCPPGTRLVSLLEVFHQHAATYCFPRDGHPSPEGHRLAAEAYEKVVLEAARVRLAANSTR